MVKRTSFHFSEDAARQLELIADIANYSSPGDVIRTAILRLDEMLDVYSHGGELFIKVSDEEVVPYHYRMPLDYPAFSKFYNEHFENAGGKPESAEASQFFFSGVYLEGIKSIKRKLGAISNADVIRLALASFRDCLVAIKVSSQIWYRSRDGISGRIDIHQAIGHQIERLHLMHDTSRARRVA